MRYFEDIIFIHKAAFLAKVRSIEAAKEIVSLSIEAFNNAKGVSSHNFDNSDNSDIFDKKDEKEIKQVEELLEIKNRDKKILTGLSLGIVGAVAFSFFYFNKSE